MSTLYTWAVTEGIEHAFEKHDVDFLVTPGWSWISVYSAIAGGYDARFLDGYKLINPCSSQVHPWEPFHWAHTLMADHLA